MFNPPWCRLGQPERQDVWHDRLPHHLLLPADLAPLRHGGARAGGGGPPRGQLHEGGARRR